MHCNSCKQFEHLSRADVFNDVRFGIHQNRQICRIQKRRSSCRLVRIVPCHNHDCSAYHWLSLKIWKTICKTNVKQCINKEAATILNGRISQASQKGCLSSCYPIAFGDFKRNIYENKTSVCKASKCWKMTY